MSYSDTQLANLALARLGIDPITSIDDGNKPARTCKTFLSIVRDDVLRAADWGFARRRVELSLVSENPTDDWRYAYRAPTDCLKILEITSTVGPDWRIKYEIESDDTGTLIYTMDDSPVLLYTKRISTSANCPSDFVMAVAYRLAAEICEIMGKGADRRKEIFTDYVMQLSGARATNANDERFQRMPEAKCFTDRALAGYTNAEDTLTLFPDDVTR